VKHSLLPRDGRKSLLRTTTGAPHTGVRTHRQDARQLMTVRARRSRHETRACGNKTLTGKDGATRHPTHLRFPTSLRRDQDAALTTRAAERQCSMLWWYASGARVDVCRWPQHPAYGTHAFQYSTQARTQRTPTHLSCGGTAVEENLASHTSWTQSKVQLCCQEHAWSTNTRAQCTSWHRTSLSVAVSNC